MNFRFYMAIITAAVLGLIGYIVGGIAPLPLPYSLTQSKLIYASLGILVGLLIFAKLTTWIIKAFTSLSRKLILTVATEIINQLTSLTSAGIPFLNPGGSKKHSEARIVKPTIIDTSALIDGRVLSVAKTGFLSELILIPDFVLTELQQVADSSDSIKRSRGRRGFEIINELQKMDELTIQIWDKKLAGKTVDDKLIRLSKITKGKLLTCDFNLSKVAQVSSIKVLNLNELTNSLKSLPVPGETLQVKIVAAGKDRTQGVGYLADGTMVVIKDGSNHISENLKVEVTKLIQGPAGRMIFGRIA